MPRKWTQRPRRTGPTSVNGLSKSPMFLRQLKETRVLSSRTRQLIMPSQPSLTRRLTIRERHWLFSMKSSFRVSTTSTLPLITLLIDKLDGLECGGAYLKLLQDNKALHAEEFSNASPYIIMFGPDKCGATNKVGSLAYHSQNLPLTKCRSTLSSGIRILRPVNTRRST